MSICVTYVRDLDPAAVIAAMTTQDRGTVSGLTELRDRNAELITLIGAAQLNNWTVAFAPLSTIGVTKGVMLPLSEGRDILSHSIDMSGRAEFYLWTDGTRSTYIDPVLRCGAGNGPIPSDWLPRMQEVGVDPFAEGPLPDGRFNIVETTLATAANYTGVRLTPEFLATTDFLIGEADDG